jgi:hypothetical protein
VCQIPVTSRFTAIYRDVHLPFALKNNAGNFFPSKSIKAVFL